MARSRFRRSPDDLPPLRWTERDDAIMRTVLRCRCCLVEHLQQLHFPSYKTAAERSMKLFHHGYLDRLPLDQPDGGQPAMVHVLAARGLERLRATGAAGVPETSPDPAAYGDLRQAVLVADAVVAFARLAQHPGVEVPIAAASPSPGWTIAPDAAIVLDVPARLFRRILLLDVSTPSNPTSDADTTARDWDARLSAWRDWARRGREPIEEDLARLLSSAPKRTRSPRTRVSIGIVTNDAADQQHLAARAASINAGALIHLTTIDALARHGAGGPAWVQAGLLHRSGEAARRTSVLE